MVILYPTIVGLSTKNPPIVLLCTIAQKWGVHMYDSSKTAEIIKNLAKSKQISIKDLLEGCGLSKNALSSMAVRGSWMQANNLAKIADYLDCSVDYLLGRTDSPELIKKAPPIGGAGEEYEIDKDAPPLSAEEIARLRQFLRDSNPDAGK